MTIMNEITREVLTNTLERNKLGVKSLNERLEKLKEEKRLANEKFDEEISFVSDQMSETVEAILHLQDDLGITAEGEIHASDLGASMRTLEEVFPAHKCIRDEATKCSCMPNICNGYYKANQSQG